MATARLSIPFDATWQRAWECDDFFDLDALALVAPPAGPKRGDMARVISGPVGAWYQFTEPGSYTQVSGFATSPVNLSTDVVDRLTYAHLPEVNGPALIGNTAPGLADANQFQPNAEGDVLYYDGTDLTFQPLPAEKTIGTWVPIAYSAGNFTGSGTITWTVASGDVEALEYVINNDATVTLNVRVTNTDISGTGNVLNIALPAAITPVRSLAQPSLDNDAGVGLEIGFISMTAGVPRVQFVRPLAANWGVGSGVATYTVVTYQITP